MTWVPRNRASQLERLRSGRQKAIIVGGVPIPAGEDTLPGGCAEGRSFLGAEVRDQVSCEAELVRGLERTRFRDFLGNQIALPHGRAKSLEDFEAGLRAAGLMGVNEILVQSGKSGRKFRIQKCNVVDDRHRRNSTLVEPSPEGTRSQHSAVVTGVEGAGSRRFPHSKLGRRPRF